MGAVAPAQASHTAAPAAAATVSAGAGSGAGSGASGDAGGFDLLGFSTQPEAAPAPAVSLFDIPAAPAASTTAGDGDGAAAVSVHYCVCRCAAGAHASWCRLCWVSQTVQASARCGMTCCVPWFCASYRARLLTCSRCATLLCTHSSPSPSAATTRLALRCTRRCLHCGVASGLRKVAHHLVRSMQAACRCWT